MGFFDICIYLRSRQQMMATVRRTVRLLSWRATTATGLMTSAQVRECETPPTCC